MKPRQLQAILFLILISLQIGGYYGFMELLKKRLSEKTANRIATEQAPIGGQLILKVPVPSYLSMSGDYSAGGGDHFTFEGKVYQVIERYVHNDVLYIVCLHDDRSTDAQQTIESFAQSLAGKTGNDQNAPVKFFENMSKFFCSRECSCGIIAQGWTSELQFGSPESLYISHQQDNLFHPPSSI